MPPFEKENDSTQSMMDHVMRESAPVGATEATEDTSGDTSGQTTDGSSSATDGNAAKGTAPADGTGAARRTTEQRPAPGQRPTGAATQGQEQKGKLAEDNKGNLIDAAGRIIAQAGSNRRYVEGLHREYNKALQEVTRLRAQSETYDKTFATLREAGLQPTDLHIGATLLKQFRADPVATIRSLVTEARAKGYNVELDGASLDMSAVKTMIDEGLAPVRQAREERERLQQAEQRAVREVTELFTQFPQARVQEASLARMATLPKFQGMSLREQYLTLHNLALQNGLDMNRDIMQQIEERAAAAATGGTVAAKTAERPANGGGIPTGTGTTQQTRRVDTRRSPAPVGTPVEDRVQAALAEHGITRG